MATGRRALEGRSRASLLAAILERDPPAVSSVRTHLPAALDPLIMTCLAKDPEDRWQDARDVASQLRWIGQGSSRTEVGVAAPRKRRRPRWPLGLAALALAIAAFVGGWFARTAPTPPIIRASLSLPIAPGELDPESLALSPDGSRLVFAARGEGSEPALWIRPLAEGTARALPGTEGATYPFWSPDSRHLGFFAGGKLKRVAADGGAVLTICGAPAQLTEPPAEAAATHRLPRFLADGEHLLFFVAHDPTRPTGLYVTDLDSGEIRPLAEEESEGYVIGGRLLYYRDGNLLARRFDQDGLRLVGPPRPIAQRIAFSDNRWTMSLAVGERALLYLEDKPEITQLTWLDAAGRELSKLGGPGRHDGLQLAPDGQRALVVTQVAPNENRFMMLDTTSGDRQPFPLPVTANSTVAWSPDGLRLAYANQTEEGWELRVLPSIGAGEEVVLYSSPVFLSPTDWTVDGWVVFRRQDPATGLDVWAVPAEGSAAPRPILQSEANEYAGFVSPDGRWLSFASDESGRFEVYVTSFPEPGRRWQITSEGGFAGRWAADGSALAFLAFGEALELWTVSVDRQGDGLRFGSRGAALGGLDLSGIIGDVDRNLDRFLLTLPEERSSEVSLNLILDWKGLLANDAD